MKLKDFLIEVNGKESDIANYTGDEALCMVKQNGLALQYVNVQTPELCLEAMKQDGDALQFVKVQTPELCLEAMKQYGNALQYVHIQTPEICLEAVKQNGYALRFVDKSIFDKDKVTIELTQ